MLRGEGWKRETCIGGRVLTRAAECEDTCEQILASSQVQSESAWAAGAAHDSETLPIGRSLSTMAPFSARERVSRHTDSLIARLKHCYYLLHYIQRPQAALQYIPLSYSATAAVDDRWQEATTCRSGMQDARMRMHRACLPSRSPVGGFHATKDMGLSRHAQSRPAIATCHTYHRDPTCV